MLDLLEPLEEAGDGGEVVEVEGRQLALPGRVTKVSLELPDGLELARWKKIGSDLHACGGSLMWWIGDWVRYGKRYGDKYEGAIAATGLTYGTIANAKMVADRYDEFSLRSENLGWHQHKAAAAIKDDEVLGRLIDMAAAEQWTVAKMRSVVSAVRSGAPLAEAQDEEPEEADEYQDLEVVTDNRDGRERARRFALINGELAQLKEGLLTVEAADLAAAVPPESRLRIAREASAARDWLENFLDCLEIPNAKAA